MLGRILAAAGFVVLFAPVLVAQPTTGSIPGMRAPRLAVDSALSARLPPVRLADGADLPVKVNLRFEPFTPQSRRNGASALPSAPEPAELPRCWMPVERGDSTHDRMPVSAPDSTKKYFILVAPPQCVVEASR